MTYELLKQLHDAGFPLSGYTGLSELIEACGDGFHLLRAVREFEGGEDMWSATNLPDNAIGNHIARLGSTPEEAVAKLWLALNEKHEQQTQSTF